MSELEPRGAALALILATERLVAQHGSSVSFRQITEAAGVANTSAIQYHFGTREALLRAVFQYRLGKINARRRDYLAELGREGQLLDQRRLIGALVHPLSEQLGARLEGNYYVRFLERRSREGPDAHSEMPGDMLAGWTETEQLLKQTISYFPPPIIGFRIRLMREQAVSGLASIEASLEHGGLARNELPLHIELLIDAGVTILAGPISIQSLQLLKPAVARDVAARLGSGTDASRHGGGANAPAAPRRARAPPG